ncbi:methyltransferase family protein [Humitalea rosea]|uniref:Methyltransferase family protein n=1 Tax=Humitalea rosea TaxID=990373 RepID=A0A2W7JG29_9PROT|nr:methyltransferase domain-containing protein [Humitalea rosea]PZW51033.1 methyltransferase family protein [Humitalea rosea]
MTFTALDRLRRLLPAGLRAGLNRATYEIAYRLPAVADTGFFNGGYRPLLPGLLAVPQLAASPSQANLYELVLRHHPGAHQTRPARLLDIGCGAGGGLAYAAAAWPQCRLTGVDASASAIAAARRRLGHRPDITLLRARGEALPLADASFDMVASVGTLTNVGAAAFLAEATRVLVPGGLLSISAGTGWSIEDYRRMLSAAGAKAGLRLLRLTDITQGAMLAIEADAMAHAVLFESLPGFLRGQAREWAAMPGSARHARYGTGARRDVGAVFQRLG